MDVQFRPGRVDAGDGLLLFNAMAAEMLALYSGLELDAPEMPKAGPAQHSARRMYEEAGYAPIGNFNANPVATFFGEKAL